MKLSNVNDKINLMVETKMFPSILANNKNEHRKTVRGTIFKKIQVKSVLIISKVCPFVFRSLYLWSYPYLLSTF